MNILYIMFSWPQGIVVGNLIANVLWVTPGFIVMHILHRRHFGRLHSRISELENERDTH